MSIQNLKILPDVGEWTQSLGGDIEIVQIILDKARSINCVEH